MAERRKRVEHYHEPGDVHELTFSCYGRMPLLTNDHWRSYLVESIDHSIKAGKFRLIAFVFMPEHVHLLVLPSEADVRVGAFLAGVKRPCSTSVKQDLESSGSPLLQRLTVRERPGKTVFRFWQEGPGYDRNLQTEKSVVAAIDYIHANPVRRGLCEQACQWIWSSARYYQGNPPQQDSRLPEIHGLPADFFVDARAD